MPHLSIIYLKIPAQSDFINVVTISRMANFEFNSKSFAFETEFMKLIFLQSFGIHHSQYIYISRFDFQLVKH